MVVASCPPLSCPALAPLLFSPCPIFSSFSCIRARLLLMFPSPIHLLSCQHVRFFLYSFVSTHPWKREKREGDACLRNTIMT